MAGALLSRHRACQAATHLSASGLDLFSPLARRFVVHRACAKKVARARVGRGRWWDDGRTVWVFVQKQGHAVRGSMPVRLLARVPLEHALGDERLLWMSSEIGQKAIALGTRARGRADEGNAQCARCTAGRTWNCVSGHDLRVRILSCSATMGGLGGGLSAYQPTDWDVVCGLRRRCWVGGGSRGYRWDCGTTGRTGERGTVRR